MAKRKVGRRKGAGPFELAESTDEAGHGGCDGNALDILLAARRGSAGNEDPEVSGATDPDVDAVYRQLLEGRLFRPPQTMVDELMDMARENVCLFMKNEVARHFPAGRNYRKLVEMDKEPSAWSVGWILLTRADAVYVEAHLDGLLGKRIAELPETGTASQWGAVRLYDLPEIPEPSSYQRNDAERRKQPHFERAIATCNEKRLTPCPDIGIVRPLREKFPNFGELWDLVERSIALQKLAPEDKRHFHLDPVLLIGAPGLGKTRAVSALADAVKGGFHDISMSNGTAGFILSGLDAGWSTGKPGKIFDILVGDNIADPIVLLDEIDKGSTDTRYDPYGPLYGLLEPHSAKRFRDECVPELMIDTSYVSWMATANYPERIPKPIMSRLTCIKVHEPTREQGMAIARSVYEDILQASWGGAFERELDEEVAWRLSGLVPREMRRLLLAGLGNAAHAGRVRVQHEDIRIREGGENERSMGFI